MKKIVIFMVSLVSEMVLTVLSSIGQLYINHNWFRGIFEWVAVALGVIVGIIAYGIWNLHELLCFILGMLVYCGIMLLLEHVSQE